MSTTPSLRLDDWWVSVLNNFQTEHAEHGREHCPPQIRRQSEHSISRILWTAHFFRLDRGISLIEIMVALFIVGLATSVAITTFPDPKTDLDSDLDRFRMNVEVAKHEAIVSGQTLRFSIGPDGYGVQKWSNFAWTDVANGASNAFVRWHGPLIVENMDRPNVNDLELLQEDDDRDKIFVRFDSTATVTPLRLRLSTINHTRTAIIDASGTVKVLDDDDQF